MARLLAFLICERATVGQSGKVTLHELFDGMSIAKPRMPSYKVRGDRPNFYVYYKVVAYRPLTIAVPPFGAGGSQRRSTYRASNNGQHLLGSRTGGTRSHRHAQ